MKSTIVTRIPVNTAQLETAIQNLCDVHYAAGYRLAAMQVVATELILIFQKP